MAHNFFSAKTYNQNKLTWLYKLNFADARNRGSNLAQVLLLQANLEFFKNIFYFRSPNSRVIC